MLLTTMLAATSLALRSIALLQPQAELLDKRQTLCLAEAIYHEARGEPYIGQVLVAETILNRAKRSNNGNICKTMATKGQFPWWKHHRSMPIKEEVAFKRAAELAVHTQLGTKVATPFPVYYFFGKTEWRYFKWANTRHTVRIGSHIFLPLQATNDKF